MKDEEFQRYLEGIQDGYNAAKKQHRGWFDFNAKELNKISTYGELKALKPSVKAAFIFCLIDFIKKQMGLGQRIQGMIKYGITGFPRIYTELLKGLLRTKADFTPEQIVQIFNHAREIARKGRGWTSFGYWPHGLVIRQLEKGIKAHGLSTKTAAKLANIASWPEFDDQVFASELSRYRGKLLSAIDTVSAGTNAVRPYKMLSGDGFGEAVEAELKSLDDDSRNKWYELFHQAASVKGGKPTKRFGDDSTVLLEAVGPAKFKTAMHRWMPVAAGLDLTETPYPNNPEYMVTTFLTRANTNLLKGLMWMMVRFHDDNSMQLIADLALKTFQKIPGQGPAAPALGNACIYVLGQAKGLSGVSHLSRLKLRIRQTSTQKLIQEYIDQRADKLGLKPAEIEQAAAPDFGLQDGKRVDEFGDYRFETDVTSAGTVANRWLNADGKEQKSVPAAVKSSKPLAKKLADLRNTVKQIKQASTAQRDRIDRLYVEDMTWPLEDVEKYYIHHGLVSFVARKLIWTLVNGDDTTDAMNSGEGWQDVAGNSVKTTAETTVRLWHPIDSSTEDVLAWRARLEELQITQPLKQAHREIYLLTDAEIATRSYSNRMAAHILKQHQFNALAGTRGWKYSLMGWYDDGRDTVAAQKRLPQHGLVAEYWIVEMADDDEAFNDAGIWDYVATDQVRFVRDNDEAVELVDVPKIVFSEMMRDTDLFVGVASVGNDPQWIDSGGTTAARDYWTSYSFGDLSELAKTRKQLLENLLPRLKLRDVAHIDGKFLIVDGRRHTYKIHIGSTNILIAPSDKYLCIVPGRGQDKAVGKIYLPFEGDRGLSILLSKAFMLAEDDKITDATILSQL